MLIHRKLWTWSMPGVAVMPKVLPGVSIKSSRHSKHDKLNVRDLLTIIYNSCKNKLVVKRCFSTSHIRSARALFAFSR